MYRKVTARQAPSTINAIYYNRAFWDGRANNAFNGVDPFGWRSNIASTKVGVLIDMLGVPYLAKVVMPDAALASQAVGPPLSTFEMACQGQTFADLGRRLLSAKPLAGQTVHGLDSLFGQTPQILAAKPAKGLNTTYADMIKKAFDPKYWSSPSRYTIDDFGQVLKDTTAGYSQMEHNFSFFWGLSILMYESTLISDQSPFDTGAMTASAQRGQTIFSGKAGCIQCHNGPVFTAAAAPVFGIPVKPLDPANPLKPDAAPFQQIEQITRVDGMPGIYDAGFYNIGLRPPSEDIGVGGTDPYGWTLSYARQFLMMLQFLRVPDEVKPPFCLPDPPVPVNPLLPPDLPKVCTPMTPGSHAVLDGAFKAPTLRNVGLTPPYMHNGAFATLEQVVAFYNRGGDRRKTACGDTTGFGAECTNVHPAIQPLNLTAAEQADHRVACHSGPFDHPELQLQKGHVTSPSPATPKRAADIMVTIPAIGRNGLQDAGLPCFPNSGNLFGDTQTVFSQVAK
jgi:cytochrome c peroxidase